MRTAIRRVLVLTPALAAVALLLLTTAPARAIPIAEWDLASATGQSAAPLVTAANVTASAISASAGVTAWSSTAQDGFIAASGWAPGLTPDPAKYYQWSVTAAPGYLVGYETLTLALFRGIQGGNHGAQRWDLRASTDGFGSSDVYLQTFDISSSGVDQQVVFAGADVSAIGTAAGTVTFRLYGYDYTASTDFSGLGNDSGWLIFGTGANPVVTGTLVPEPGTALLVLLGVVALGRPRR